MNDILFVVIAALERKTCHTPVHSLARFFFFMLLLGKGLRRTKRVDMERAKRDDGDGDDDERESFSPPFPLFQGFRHVVSFL